MSAMSYRSRRARTSGEASTRASRIAQPTRRLTRPPSLDRAHSTDRLNVPLTLTASSVKRQRSTSATPMRTPNRPIPQPSFTTCEKERMPVDDKFLQTQAKRLNEYLFNNKDVLGKDYVQRGGIKSMTTKQFVTFFSHLLKNIVGNRLLIGTNFVDDIVAVLTQIGYPYSINKSWLKTPGAPHSINNVLVLMGWMLDMAPNTDTIDEFETDHLLDVNSVLPDKDYTHQFMSSAKVGFSLWDNARDEEFNELKRELANKYIEKSVKLNNVRHSLEGLNAYIAQIRVEVENLMLVAEDKRNLPTLEKDFKRLNDQLAREKVKLTKTEEVCHANEQNITRLEEQCEIKSRLIAETRCRIDSVEATIKAQKMTTSERDELVNQVQYLKQVHCSNENIISQLKFEYDSNQVLYSRLTKRSLDAVNAFNTHLRQVLSNQNDELDIDIETLLLTRNAQVPLKAQLDKILPLLEKFQKSAFQRIKEYMDEIADFEHKHKNAIYEHDTVLEKQLTETQMERIESSRDVEKLDEEIVRAKACEKEIEKISETFRSKKDSNRELTEKKAAVKLELEKLKNENVQMHEMVSKKLKEYMHAQKRNVELFEEGVGQLWEALENADLKLKNMDKHN